MTVHVFPYESPCASADPELWFSDDVADQLAAVSICQACPVIDACRDYADQIEGRKSIWSMHGIYAAETPRQRKTRRDNPNDTRPRCSIPICANVEKQHGLCRRHLYLLQQGKLPQVLHPHVPAAAWERQHTQQPARTPFCTTEGCDRPHKALGFCDRHYRVHRRALARKAREQAAA